MKRDAGVRAKGHNPARRSSPGPVVSNPTRETVFIDLPRRKQIAYALPYIFGIGHQNAVEICQKAGIPVEKKVERVYLTVLSRRPNPTEAAAVAAYLGHKDKAEALLEDVIWALLNTSEFRFNH